MGTQTIGIRSECGHRDGTASSGGPNLYLFAAQQRARGVPTPEVFSPSGSDNSRLVKAADPVRVREMRVFTAAMAVMFVIMMFYGWQHFSAIEYGYKVESEKQQRTRWRRESATATGGSAACAAHRIDGWRGSLGPGEPKPGQVVRAHCSIRIPALRRCRGSPRPLRQYNAASSRKDSP